MWVYIPDCDSLLTPAGCGGDLAGPAGTFNSPDYPNRYPENRECVWYIQTSPGSSITITIHEFDVEYHPNCNYDLLEVKHRSLLWWMMGNVRAKSIEFKISVIYIERVQNSFW